MIRLNLTLLKRGLLLFWAVWLSVVFTTNVLDGLKSLGLLDADWQLASGNYQYIVETTSRYAPPAWLNALLFAGVIAWEGVAALLFWRAWRWFHAARSLAVPAFVVSLALWAAFMLADEVLIAYKVEDVHRTLFTAELASLLAVYLLPDERGPGA